MMRPHLLVFSFVATSAVLIASRQPPREAPATGTSAAGLATGVAGMVSSADPRATEAGLEILRAGGNAFDAAVAVAAALNVVEPQNSGLGGYGTIMVFDASRRRARFLNSSGRIPIAVNSDVFRPPAPNYLENRRGAKAVSTPGNLHAWEAMSNEYGRLEWRRLFERAIKLAEEGILVDAALARLLEASFKSFPERARTIYGRPGRPGQPLQAGDRLVQTDLARSFRQIGGQGPKVFYRGEIARAIDRAMKAAGGFLSLRDLSADEPEWWDPIQIRYRGHDIVTASPPANTFDFLVRLGLMSRFNTKAFGHNTSAYLHHFAEATKHGFWVRLRHAGDPGVTLPPLERLLSEFYWAEEARKIDPKRARPFAPPTTFTTAEAHTTHFVVADRWGNVVSATQTLGGSFGSMLMPEGTGVWLNNSLSYCTFEPKGNPMDAHAGRRKLSGDCPTIVMRNGRPWVVLGTPGGHTIGQTMAQMVMNLIDFNMNLHQAIAAPRISFVEPDVLAVEETVPEAVWQELGRMGHNVGPARALGNAHGLTIEYDPSGRPRRFTGSADPRGRGLAKGY